MFLPQPHILMCPPDYYGIYYEINPWMNTARQADHGVAVDQWNGLRGQIEAAGARVSLIAPVEGLPDLVFTANAALIFGERALVSRFRHPQRQGEEPHNRHWLGERGFEIVEVPLGSCFEGAGDALFCGDTLFAGYRMRSDASGHQAVGRLLGVRVIPVELVDP
ncbi:MAG TPA: amidinotransferase, partial [Lacipirellulaceae bacterium]